jgi:hypothetical protein
MATPTKQKTVVTARRIEKIKVRRPGIVSKKKSSKCKNSKNYKKRYRGQGRR